MKFVLFNIAVGAAAIYLLVGDPGATARQAGLPEAAISAIDALSHKAKKTVVDNVAEVPQPIAQPEAAISAIDALSHKAKKTVVDNVAEVPQPIAQPKPFPTVAKATPKTADEPITKPIVEAQAPQTAPTIRQAAFVPTKPVHIAPTPKRNPGVEARKGNPVSLSPQLSQRRAEVLGNGKTDSKFAVKDGAAMMSPGDRYRELSKLVDDMELVYFNSLGN